MGCCRLRASGNFAGWCWVGHVGRVVLMGHWRWRVDGAGALSHSIGASVLVLEGEQPDNQHDVEGGRGEGGDNHVMELGGGF